jgi:hypothetical protein
MYKCSTKTPHNENSTHAFARGELGPGDCARCVGDERQAVAPQPPID